MKGCRATSLEGGLSSVEPAPVAAPQDHQLPRPMARAGRSMPNSCRMSWAPMTTILWAASATWKFQLFRANRCVVDTGIHHMPLEPRTGDRLFRRPGRRGAGFAAREVERYCVSPGKACSYKLGHTAIIGIRAQGQGGLGVESSASGLPRRHSRQWPDAAGSAGPARRRVDRKPADGLRPRRPSRDIRGASARPSRRRSRRLTADGDPETGRPARA